MFSIGRSSATAPILTPNGAKDHLASTRQQSNMPFNNTIQYNQTKQFPSFKFHHTAQVDLPSTGMANQSTMVRKPSPNRKRKSPSKTKQKRMTMEEIDEVGLDALEEAVPQTLEASCSYSTCPLTVKLTDFFNSTFVGCSSPKNSTSPKNTASPKSCSASPIEFINFTWLFTPNKSCTIRKRLSSDCPSEDSFVVFENDDDELDSILCTDDDSDEETEEDEESSGHDIGQTYFEDRKNIKKKVMFERKERLCVIHPMITWSFAYRAARKSHWEELGRDQARFKCRIDNIAPVINKILSPDHRNTIYQQRFQ